MLYRRARSPFYWVKVRHRGRVYRQSTGCTNKRSAQEFEVALRKRLDSLTKQSCFTFSDAAIRWLDEKEHKRSIKTDALILDWFRPHLENAYLSEITRDRVEELRKLKRAEVAPATVNRHMALLRSILRTARDDWEWIDRIPKIPMYPLSRRKPRFLTLQQFSRLAAELPPHLSAPAWFAVSTGMRTRAIQLLRWDWINRDGVRIPPEAMKGGRWLTIPLSSTAWYVLAERYGPGTGSKGDCVFVNHAGKPWAGKFTTRAWKRAAEQAGLEGVTFHDLRHTFASWMLQRGVSEAVVMELGDWRSREMFRSTYGHFSTESLERLAGYV